MKVRFKGLGCTLLGVASEKKRLIGWLGYVGTLIALKRI